VLDATLVAIAEHGLVPSVQASRMTLAAAPDALQGAVAAGILGCGSVILGASETAGRLFLRIDALAREGQAALRRRRRRGGARAARRASRPFPATATRSTRRATRAWRAVRGVARGRRRQRFVRHRRGVERVLPGITGRDLQAQRLGRHPGRAAGRGLSRPRR
jgi:citrate synthase